MKIKVTLLAMILVLSAFTFGCSSDTDIETLIADETSVTSGTSSGYDFEFTDRDMSDDYDEDDATIIELSDSDISISGQGAEASEDVLTITAEGTYILSGELNDGQVIVEVGEEEKVQLVLDGVSINNGSGAAIYVTSGDKVFITMAEGSENALSSTGSSDETDAVIFSRSDLTLNGEGNMTVSTIDGNGITSKDDLVITGGTYKINASGRGLEANDRIKIADGTFYIVAGDDGIHCENDEDDTLGYVYIKDGDFNIAAEDDGIHGNINVTIDGGTIVIEESYEGIEGLIIEINGGAIDVCSSDDGLNSAGGNDGSNAQGPGADQFSSNQDAYILITGGEINVNAYGDGIDSNGSLYISGGTIFVSGPVNDGNGALDYNGEAIISGGTIIAAGSSGMAQNFSQDSTQGSILVTANGYVDGDVELLDSNGDVILSYSPDKEYNCVVVSCADIEEGNTYYVNMGDYSQEVQMDTLIYGSAGGGGMNGGMGGAPHKGF